MPIFAPLKLLLFHSSIALATVSDTTEAPSISDPAQRMTAQAPQQKPAHADKILMALSARHPEDLPSTSQWANLPDASDALMWIVVHGPINLHRERALTALRFYPSTTNKNFLLQHLLEPQFHYLIRTGAVRGLSGQQLSKSECEQIRRVHTGKAASFQRALDTLVASSCT